MSGFTPDTDWVPVGALAWPLPQTFAVTSHFGYREDPFTGETDYHNGTDIAAPAGTPILAAAAGTVTIANGIDSWGGSYGYHIKIDHGNGLETLYAHCLAICVTAGQQVQQGEVIGYVHLLLLLADSSKLPSISYPAALNKTIFFYDGECFFAYLQILRHRLFPQ